MWQPPTSPEAGTPDGAQPPQGATYPPPWGFPPAPPWVQGPGQWSPSAGTWVPQPPAPAPRRPRSRKVVIAIVAGCVLAVAVLGAAVAGAYAVGRSAAGGMTNSAVAAAKTSAPADAAGLGDDARLNDLATRCHDGDLRACDDLFDRSAPMSRYEQYGMTCGGRVKSFDVDYCTDLG